MQIADLFPWGSEWPPPADSGNYAGEETGKEIAIKGFNDGFPNTSPVGSFPPNKYGLYDMGGNVWQWCMDNFSSDSETKVLRGGSWADGGMKANLLASSRNHFSPGRGMSNFGFRIVRAAE